MNRRKHSGRRSLAILLALIAIGWTALLTATIATIHAAQEESDHG